MISYLTGGITKAKEWLADQHPFTGRFMADDGAMVNIAEFIRRHPLSIARGYFPGAEPFGSFGVRTSTGAETNTPIWPDGPIQALPEAGAQMSIASTSPNDTANGTHVRQLEMHYLDGDLNPQLETITMNGLTPVLTKAEDIRWIQCMHLQTWGTTPSAAGVITANYAGGIYSQIDTGNVRCASSFRMVPKGKVCYIEGAVGGSVSGTADAGTVMSMVASELDNHTYHHPLLLMPLASVALQNNSLGFVFPPGLKYSEGTLIGGIHKTDKAATITMAWFGHLEPVE